MQSLCCVQSQIHWSLSKYQNDACWVGSRAIDELLLEKDTLDYAGEKVLFI